MIPFLYHSPDLTFNFQWFNLIQYNYAAFLLFELDFKLKIYFLINLISLLSIQYKNSWIDSRMILRKAVEAALQLIVLWVSYDFGFNSSVFMIFRNFFVPLVSLGLALFLEFFVFIYYFETLTDYRNFNFPAGARIKKEASGKDEQVCGDRVRFLEILSYTYFIPTFFLIFFRFILTVSNYAMLHILLLTSFPVAFKLCMITNQFEYKSYSLNISAVFFSLNVWWTLAEHFFQLPSYELFQVYQ
jgi:hypothetical protein